MAQIKKPPLYYSRMNHSFQWKNTTFVNGIDTDSETMPLIIDAATIVQRQTTARKVIVFNKALGNGPKYPTTTTADCFHCIEKFDTVPLTIPRRIEPEKNTYHCFGVFCSVACVKGYLCEHPHQRTGIVQENLYQMLTCVFGHADIDVMPAPPQALLKRFGGPLDPESYRNGQLNFAALDGIFWKHGVVFEDLSSTKMYEDGSAVDLEQFQKSCTNVSANAAGSKRKRKSRVAVSSSEAPMEDDNGDDFNKSSNSIPLFTQALLNKKMEKK